MRKLNRMIILALWKQSEYSLGAFCGLSARNVMGMAATCRYLCWESKLIQCILVKQVGSEKR